MGWTCGFAMASARDVAKFYYDLLGPEHRLVSQERLDEMQTFTTLDEGWSKGYISYGGGLFVNSANLRYGKLPPLADNATYIGHAGDTYGYESY